MRSTTLSIAAICSLCCFAVFARADERAGVAAKQKEEALDNLNKIGIGKPHVHETADLFICSALAADKLKLLGDALQKQYAAVCKALKYEGDEIPWQGKLAVYILTERGDFNSFVRQVERRRPESDETASTDVRSDSPHVAYWSDRSDTPTLAAGAARQVSFALLSRKAGTTAELPSWFKESFARAIHMRTDPRSGNIEKAAIKRAMLNSSKPVKPSDAWAEGDSKEKGLIGLSLVDYLVFGPESMKFPSVLAGLRPSDTNANPTFESALQSAGFTPEELDKGWKKWVQSGK